MSEWPEVEHFKPQNERMLPVLVADYWKPTESAKLMWLRKEHIALQRERGMFVIYCFGQVVDAARLPPAVFELCKKAGGGRVPAVLEVSAESEQMQTVRRFIGKYLSFLTRLLPTVETKQVPNPEYFPNAVRLPDLRGVTSVQMEPFRCATFSKGN